MTANLLSYIKEKLKMQLFRERLGKPMKKYVKKITSCVLILVMTICAAGCTQTTKSSEQSLDSLLDPQNPTTVTVWNYYNGDQLSAFENLVSKFNETIGASKGIVAVSVSLGSINNLADSLIDAVNGKAGAEDIPSIAAVYAETAYILEQQSAIIELNKYFSDSEIEEYIPSFIEEGRLVEDGPIMICPVSKSTEIFAVNSTDWEAFEKSTGISYDNIDTYEELTATAKAYYEYTDGLTPDVLEDGKALYGRDSVANYVFVGTRQLLGHELFTATADGVTVDMNKDVFRTLWDNYYIPYINGYFAANTSHRSEDMKTGSIISLTCSTSGVNYLSNTVTELDDTKHSININLYKPLHFKNGEDIAVQQGAGYSILKTSDAEQYAASVFLKWFTDTEQNLDFSVMSGYSPVKKSANDVNLIESAYKSINTTNVNDKDNVIDSLKISSELYSTSETYTNKPFEGSKDVRDLLGTALEDACKNDRAAVLERIAAGMSREAAVAEFSTDEYFNKWFDQLTNNVNHIIK